MIVNVIASRESEKLKTEVKCPDDEVLILKKAIEEAIIKGQESFGDLSDTEDSVVICDEELDLLDVKTGSGVVGWVDNF
jgi:hypothetical protein